MSNPNIPNPKNIEGRSFDPVRLLGGLDQETDKFTVKLGTLDDALNYVSSTRGYQRAKGLFHYDGTIDSAVSNMWVVAVDDNESTLTGSGFSLGGTVSWGSDSTGIVVFYERNSGTPDNTILGIVEMLNGSPGAGDTLTDVETGTTLVLNESLNNNPTSLVDALDPATQELIVPTITDYLEYINTSINDSLVS